MKFPTNPTQALADFNTRAPGLVGQAYTMHQFFVREFKFQHEGKSLLMQRPLPAGMYLGGFIYGLLKQASLEGIDTVLLDVDFDRKHDSVFSK